MQPPSDSKKYSASSPPGSAARFSNIAKKQESSMAPVSPVPSYNNDDPKDDFDIMLLHEDFPVLVSIAAKLKDTRQKIAYTGFLPQQPFQHRPKSALQPDAVLQNVERMQKTFLAHPKRNNKILRGSHPIVDTVLEESLLLLQNEYECGEKWLQQAMGTSQVSMVSAGAVLPSTPDSMLLMDTAALTSSDAKKRGRGGKSSSSDSCSNDAIAVKYSKWQTDILMDWMIANRDDPFPKHDAIAELTQRTGLSQSQIVNWTTNVRKRNIRATCEKGKKPHHFIDFLFLAHDREKKEQQHALYQQMYSPGAARPSLPPQTPKHVRPPRAQQPKMVPTPASAARHDQGLRIPKREQFDDEQEETSDAPREFHPELDTCISRDIFDEVDPLPMDAATEEKVLVDFAHKWTASDHKKSNHPNMKHEETLLDFMDDDIDNSNAESARMLLPSVTDESGVDQQEPQPLPVLSMGEELLAAAMDDEALQEWADDMGLNGTAV